MKKIFQTIVDRGKGNCQQAAVASLLDLSLDEVPNFIEFHNDGNRKYENTVFGFLYSLGYEPTCINRDRYTDTELLIKIAKKDGGLNGYFLGTVPSQTFDGVTHAVIINSDLNIVHDPNPNQLALNLKPDDVTDFISMTRIVIGKTGKIFTESEWELATEEEHEANTYKVVLDENNKVIGRE